MTNRQYRYNKLIQLSQSLKQYRFLPKSYRKAILKIAERYKDVSRKRHTVVKS